jgi:hypothetical protein
MPNLNKGPGIVRWQQGCCECKCVGRMYACRARKCQQRLLVNFYVQTHLHTDRASLRGCLLRKCH